MKAAFLVKYGASGSAFETRDMKKPSPGPGQVLIKVSAFGLNFADVMARLGLYKGAPPIPCVLGYDVVGYVEQCGMEVTGVTAGDRVAALTRFGGYAEYVLAQCEVVNKVPEDTPAGIAVALATQYSTAYFLAFEMANLQENDHVLIHAAAGGVGTGLVQMALRKKCIVFGTCSSPEKVAYLRGNGVHYPINYREKDFAVQVKEVLGSKGMDVVFDPVGGKSVKKGYQLLGAGGRICTFGVSSMNNTTNIFGKLRVLFQFGIYHPLQFLSRSRGILGINMLRIAEENPQKIGRTMKGVIALWEKGEINPYVGGEYPIDKLAEAHEFLESGKSMGKIVVSWE